MRIAVGSFLLLAATACTSGGTDTGTDNSVTDGTIGDDVPPPIDTGWPPGELGNV